MEAHEGSEKRAGSHEITEAAKLIELGDLTTGGADFRGAVVHYQKALSLLSGQRGEPRVSTLRKLGYALMRLGEVTKALSVLQDATYAVDERTSSEERSRVDIQLGKALLSCGQVVDARERASRALEHLENRPPSVEVGLAHNLQGTVALRLGEADEAMKHYRTALAIFKDLGDLMHIGTSYYNIGLLHKNACNWTQALENFQVARGLMVNEGDYHNLPQVMQGMGLVHLKMGNLQEAHALFESALKKFRQIGDSLSIARAMLGEAEILRLREDLTGAGKMFREALEICMLNQHLREGAIAYVGLAEVALTEGNLDEALRTAERAAQISENLGGKGDLAAQVQMVLAKLALRATDKDRALQQGNLALQLSSGSGDRIREARSMAVLGQVQVSLGRSAEATALFESGARILRDAGERYYLAETLESHGRLLIESSGDRDRLKGLQLYLEAMECYRAMGLRPAEARVQLQLAGEDIRQRALDRAADRLEAVRRLEAEGEFQASLTADIRDLYGRLERAYVATAESARGIVDARRQMEGILRSEISLEEKIGDFLGILSAAIPSDGACLARIAEKELRIIGARNIPSLRAGEKVRLPLCFQDGDWPRSETPLIFLGLDEKPGADALLPFSSGRDLVSAIVVPLAGTDDHWSVLYVDRLAVSGHRHFHQAEISYCLALARQLAGFLEEASIKNQRGLRELRRMEQHIALADIVTQNPEMQSILGLVSRVADSDLTVLLQGETGTGKKLIAGAIHECSPRAGKPFVTVDCAALPESILESELFGYIKGAFTGALNDRPGILEQAHGGTVFLDEIDKMGIAVQRRFLHLLDCGEIRPVGGREYRTLDIRVVCATSSPDIRAEVERGEFIKDLYYRLNDVSICVPVLRRRKEDIPLLAEYFVELFAQEIGKRINGISRIAMKKLIDYDWPGNVRELEKAMRRAVTLADEGETIGIDLLPPRFLEEADEGVELPSGQGVLKQQLEDIERQLVLKALQQFSWNKSRAAAHLGLSRKGLKNKISRYGLDRRARGR